MLNRYNSLSRQTCLFTFLYVCISVCQYVCMSVCLYVCISVCLSVCLYVCMSVCLYYMSLKQLYVSVCLFTFYLECFYIFYVSWKYIYNNFHLRRLLFCPYIWEPYPISPIPTPQVTSLNEYINQISAYFPLLREKLVWF